MKLFLTILVPLLLSVQTVYPAQLQGRVVTEDNAPLIGVSVVTDVTGVGTQTDESGEFRLHYDERVTRVTFSAVGYESRQYRLDDVPEVVTLKRTFYRGEGILVTAGRAEIGISPIAFDNFSTDDINRDYAVDEVPTLIETTPNLYTFSYGGAGLGATEYKIRGFDSKRIAVYIDGIPLNDPEDHTTYFVDIPDFPAEITDIQVQRGVGLSMYGNASFGGSINIASGATLQPHHVSVTSGFGAHFEDGEYIGDIRKQALHYSSGLIDGRWLLAGRYSKLFSDGYREASWYNGWAYFFSLSRLDPKMTTTANVYGGPVKYHHAWYGISSDMVKTNRRFNPTPYENETDNFSQPHYELHHAYFLANNLRLRNTLYYIRGKGYYEQFRQDQLYRDYNIPTSAITGDDSTGNLVRQLWVTKHQYGWSPRLDWDHERGKASFGGSLYYFTSDHWGQVVWAENVHALNPRQRYYTHYGKKAFASLFAHDYYHINDRWGLMGDLQLKYIWWDFDQDSLGAFPGYQFDLDWLFLSPRVGLNYSFDSSSNAYVNFAISSREPNDVDIYDANDPHKFPQLETLLPPTAGHYTFGDPTVEPERVIDVELGMQTSQQQYQLGLNAFWMRFENENVFEAGVDVLDRPITINIDESVHAGVELAGAVKPHEKLTLSGNLSLNRNRVTDYDSTYFYSVDTTTVNESVVVDFEGKTTPGFPEYLGNLIVDYRSSWYRLTYRIRAVGKQYMDMFNSEDHAIDDFVTSSLSASLTWRDFMSIGHLTVTGRVYNLFNERYVASGYGGNYVTRAVNEPPKVNAWAEYYVGPERSVYCEVTLELF